MGQWRYRAVTRSAHLALTLALQGARTGEVVNLDALPQPEQSFELLGGLT